MVSFIDKEKEIGGLRSFTNRIKTSFPDLVPNIKLINPKISTALTPLSGKRQDLTCFAPVQKLKTSPATREFLQQLTLIGQFDKKCIVTSLKMEKETQIWMFDQHASHERVNLENILKTYPNLDRDEANVKACKSAVRFGDVLSNEIQAEIIEKLSKCEKPFHCAHGRPTCWLLARII